MSSDNVRKRVRDVIDNAERAMEHVGDMTFEQSVKTPMLYDACERCIMRLSEAAIKIGETIFAEIVPDVPFHKSRGMGNALRHDYDLVEEAVIFATVQNDLPRLADQCRAWLLANADDNS